jgi:exopolyphosphatase/guanosine-5'-triphosphate,3'-diphosphate pyrophosphatase
VPVAVIDMGSNSTRLLVADLADPSNPRELERRSTVTGLARGVDSSGQLSPEAIDDVCEVIAGYLELARSRDADPVIAVATSAVRDAANGEAFIAELRERFALEAVVIDGATEARLTYRGATAGREVKGPMLVFDIGGGSTELIVGDGGNGAEEEELAFRESLQVGVVRHSERYLTSDPPEAAELEALADSIGEELAAVRAAYGGATPSHAIAVAGTPLSMAAIELELEPYDGEAVEGHVIGIEFLQHQLGRLASLSIEDRRRVTGLHPDRAPTIVTGVVILIATMRAFGIDQVEVSKNDLLLGVALGSAGRS